MNQFREGGTEKYRSHVTPLNFRALFRFFAKKLCFQKFLLIKYFPKKDSFRPPCESCMEYNICWICTKKYKDEQFHEITKLFDILFPQKQLVFRENRTYLGSILLRQVSYLHHVADRISCKQIWWRWDQVHRKRPWNNTCLFHLFHPNHRYHKFFW